MNVKDYVAALIKTGAVISIRLPGGGSDDLLLAELIWEDNPRRFKWCAVYPVDQHHLHTVPYATAKMEHGIYVVIHDAAGRMIACISSIKESSLDTDATTDLLAQWQATLRKFSNQKQFERFFEDNED